MEKFLRPSQRPADSKANGYLDEVEHARIDCREVQIPSDIWRLVTYGLGFLIWNLDTVFCSILRRWRRGIGLPWGLLLEVRGWW